MHTNNRILSIIREKDESTKENLLTDLHNQVVLGGAFLNDRELDELCKIVRAKEKSRTILSILWILALESKYHPALEQYAREIVEQREHTTFWSRLRDHSIQHTYRRYAVSYLHRHNSAYFVRNLQQFMQDTDPYILYEAACEIGKSSAFQKIAMMIQFYHKIETHSMVEIVTAEILEAGTMEHLEMIREKMKDPRKRYIYREVAACLEAELKKKQL